MVNKNNKILIYEIAKMQKLMTGTLILEQFIDLIDDVLKYAGKLAGKLPDNFEQLVLKLGKAATEEETIKILADMAKYSDEMASIIVPKVMSTISDVERKYINDFKLVLKDAVENGMDIERLKTSADDWVNKNVKTQFDGVQDIIKKELTDYVDDVAKKVDTQKPPTPKPNPKSKSMTDIGGQSFENITPLSPDELKKLEKMYRQKGFGQSYFRAMRIFWKSVEDMMTKQTELMDETLSLIKSYATPGNSFQKSDILRRIGDNVITLTQRDKENYKLINQWIIDNVPETKQIFGQPFVPGPKEQIKGVDGYMSAARIFDGKALDEWKKTYKGLKERRTQILSQLNSILNPASWAPGVMKSKFGTETTTSYWLQVAEKWKQIIYGPKFAELRRYILTGQSQSWKGIEDFRKEFGFLPAIKTVVKEYLWNYVALSGILASIDFMTDYLGAKSQTKELPDVTIMGFSSKEWLKNQAESWDQHINPEKVNNTTKVEKSVQGGLELVGDFLKYLLDEAVELDVVIPGVIDDILFMYYVSRNDEATEEERKNALTKGEVAFKKIKSAMANIETKSKNIVKSGIDKIKSGIDKRENTPLGFKAFIIDNWIDDKTKKSQLTGTEKFGKEGDNYTVTSGNVIYSYIYNGTTFEQKK
jgi:hypothetical protein